jgi:hypothetical protein
MLIAGLLIHVKVSASLWYFATVLVSQLHSSVTKVSVISKSAAAGIGLHIHSGLTPRGLPLSDAAKATAADSRHKSAATPFIF